MIYYDESRVMIRSAVTSDIGRLADQLRASDIREVWASHHHSPLQALTYSFAVSFQSMTVVFRGVPVAMLGVVPDNESPDRGSIWFLATNGIYQMRYSFARLSLYVIEEQLRIYPCLYNWVDERNQTTIRWLEWCGARFSEAMPYGVDQLPFRFFTIEKARTLCHV